MAINGGSGVTDYSIAYLQLQQLASGAGLRQSGAEMLGMICADSAGIRGTLDTLAFDEIHRVRQSGDLSKAVEQLYRETWESLDGAGLGFSLLLPGEDASHAERCNALIDWARGFLRGLAIVGVHGGDDLELNGRHALSDIARIAECDSGKVSDDHEDFEEACECVWVITVLARQLLRLPDRAAALS